MAKVNTELVSECLEQTCGLIISNTAKIRKFDEKTVVVTNVIWLIKLKTSEQSNAHSLTFISSF